MLAETERVERALAKIMGRAPGLVETVAVMEAVGANVPVLEAVADALERVAKARAQQTCGQCAWYVEEARDCPAVGRSMLPDSEPFLSDCFMPKQRPGGGGRRGGHQIKGLGAR